MSFYQTHQRKSAILNLPTKISTYLSGPEVFYKPARVVTPFGKCKIQNGG